MANVFKDQAKFMQACGQTVGTYNLRQLDLYIGLVGEEFDELLQAQRDGDKVEILDALLDIIVVAVGGIHSLGVDAEEGWAEVNNSNLAKIDPETGLVRKREDGKVLKPEGWQPPDLGKLFS